MTINIASSSLGPLFAGVTRDWQGDFNLALVAFAIAPLPIALLSLRVAPPQVEAARSHPALAAVGTAAA